MRSRRPNQSATPPPATPPGTPGAPPARLRRGWLAVGVVLVGVAVAVAVFRGPRQPAPEKPAPPAPPAVEPAPLAALTASPFRNTKPGVEYVGDKACLECHTDYKGYHDHPMGRSLFRTPEAPPLEQFGAVTRFQSGLFRFEVTREGDKQIHREWCADAAGKIVAEQREEMAYTIGSGSQGRSYLYNRGGFLFESPITWYAQRQGFHLSPGYEAHAVHFTRRIGAKCLYCHANETHPVENSTNLYQNPPFGQLSVGCERCHGPGELHANHPGAQGEVDYSIVNPRHLASHLRDAICEQCHLQGEAVIPRRGRDQSEYRPGLPLHEYVTVFVRPPELDDASKIVGHAEQMRQSACYAKSAGQFACTSCHDPHRAPPAAGGFAYYEEKCRACHAPPKPPPAGKVTAPDCSLPAEKRVKDGRRDCLVCHMPRNPSVTNQHLAVTDHRLLRKAGQVRHFSSDFRPGTIPLVPFHAPQRDRGDPDLERDLALAGADLAGRAKRNGAREVGDFMMQQSLFLLDRAARRDPGDLPVLENRGYVLLDQRRAEEALEVFGEALAKAPDREQALSWAVEAAIALDRLDEAETYGRRLVERYPHYPPHRDRLAAVLLKRKAWPEALAQAEASVRGNPFRARSREQLIEALLETGDVARARAEFDAVGVIDPAYQPRLRERFGARLGLGK